MKKIKELDVDFIGEQRPLTSEEEAISNFIKSRKNKKRDAAKKVLIKKKSAA